MKILLCCQQFYPQGGGVGKMLQEIGRRLVLLGHCVDVATCFSSERVGMKVDGIQIIDFKISGNEVTGIHATAKEITRYQTFLINGKYDALIVMAAQQWSLDLMLPILNKIPYKKFHIPCGYSSFYEKNFQSYYENMKTFILKFDGLVFNSTDYRDINFAKGVGHPNIVVIPAGASEFEFETHKDLNVKSHFKLVEDDFVFLSVGAPAYHKGHKELVSSYLKANLSFQSVLILNGDYNNFELSRFFKKPKNLLRELIKRFIGISPYNIVRLAKKNKNKNQNKRIIFSNLKRDELISLFFEADLFLFASHIEYSPLVIFECLAAGLPFLSVPVGNVGEIVKWSGAGVMCHDVKTIKRRVFVNTDTFASQLEKLSNDKEQLIKLSIAGRESWAQKFNWMVISKKLEKFITD